MSWHRKGHGRLAAANQGSGIRHDQVAKFTYAGRMQVWNDSTHRDARNQLAQKIELRSTLFSVQKPIHVGVLHKPKQCLARANLLNPWRIFRVGPWREEVDYAWRPLLWVESCSFAIERQ